MRTSCLLSFCSYVALFVSSLSLCIYIYTQYILFSFCPPPALSCPALLSGPFSKISCRALEANRFWEGERESLSKWRLQLGEGQCAEMCVLLPCIQTVGRECTRTMHTEIQHWIWRIIYCTGKTKNGGKKREAEKNIWYDIKHETLYWKNSIHFIPKATFSL